MVDIFWIIYGTVYLSTMFNPLQITAHLYISVVSQVVILYFGGMFKLFKNPWFVIEKNLISKDLSETQWRRYCNEEVISAVVIWKNLIK